MIERVCVAVFEALKSWVRKDFASREQYLPQLYRHIRLPLLNINYLQDFARKMPEFLRIPGFEVTISMDIRVTNL
jgi:hypothetical protein